MQLNGTQREELEQMRGFLLVEIANGGGVRTAFRSRNLEFDERRATILMDQHEVRLPDGRSIFVYDRVCIDWPRTSKWSPWVSENSELDHCLRTAHKMADHQFHVLAFVRVPGDVRGGMLCEGIFVVLSQTDPAHTEADDTGKFDPVKRICRGQEIGREKGKVMLYPIECLVPAKEPPAPPPPPPGRFVRGWKIPPKPTKP